jgi:GTPase SAR1 family protein
MHEQPGVLLAEVRELLVSARAELGPEAHVELDRVLKRIDEPLRVAIAGKVKAGKSTLLNALVGERIAPTDTGECTRIVTWYRNGHTYQVMLHPREGGPPVQVSFRKGDEAVEIELGPFDPAAVDHLDVMWPS